MSMPAHAEPSGPDRAERLRALFVVPLYACARNTGGGQRTFHLYESLLRFCELDVLLVSQPETQAMEAVYPALYRKAFPKASNLYLQACHGGAAPMPNLLRRAIDRMNLIAQPRDAFYRPHDAAVRQLHDLVADARYDLVVGRYLLPTSRSGAFTLDGVPVFVDIDDRDDKVIESRLMAPTTRALAKPILRRQLTQTRAVMADLLARCAHVWLASDDDRDEVDHRSKSALPNIPYVPPSDEAASPSSPPDPLSERTIVFVGTYGHRVNRDGVMQFVRTCWPAIRRAVPDAQLRIVGSGGWEQARHVLEGQPGVVVVGRMNDIGQAYRDAAFSVVPLLEGSGTKIKVLESFRYRRTVVAHAHAVRGFDKLRHGQSLLVADCDDDMVRHCIALLNDATHRRTLAERGHAVVAQEYSLQRFAATVHDDVTARMPVRPHAHAVAVP